MSQEMWVIAGSNTGGPDRFRIAPFDSATGTLGPFREDAAARTPSHFVLSADRRFLYACLSDVVPGLGEGGLGAYEVDALAGTLREINVVAAGGVDTCQNALDHAGRHVLAVNYANGSVVVHAIRPDGGLGERTAYHRFETAGSVDRDRQEAAHAHAVITDPRDRFALVADLGTDCIWIFGYDAATGAFTTEPRVAKLAPGDGPRHLAFHPDGRTLYVVNELSNTLLACAWDGETGTVTPGTRVSTLPEGQNGVCYAAEIVVDPRGRWLYVTNRNDEDSVAVFALDAHGGAKRVQVIPTEGSFPRYLERDPSGHWMIALNQLGASGMVYAVDQQSGTLLRHAPFELNLPFGVRFLPRR